MNNAFPSRKMKDCELAHSFCFWKPYKHTRKMAKVLSFETIPHFYWKNDKGVKPANGIQPAFCGDFITFKPQNICQHLICKTLCLTIYCPCSPDNSRHHYTILDSIRVLATTVPISTTANDSFKEVRSLGEQGTSRPRSPKFKTFSTRVLHGLQLIRL